MTTISYQPVTPTSLTTIKPATTPKLTSSLYYYSLLAISVLAISCAGTLQRELSLTPPLLRAFWRLACVSIALFPPFVIQLLYYTSAHQRAAYLNVYTREWLYICICGIVTSVHFGSWIVSLDLTSLTHSLTLVSVHPLILTLYYWLMHTRLSTTEYAGVGLGTLGTLILCAGLGNTADNNTGANTYEHAATWYGDATALLGAITLVINILLGQQVRQKFSLFLFVFPVTLISTVPLLIITCMFENTCNISQYTSASTTSQLFGFVYTPQLYYMMCVALGPGLLGHTVMNYLLPHVNPLSISLGYTCEPILGSLIGVMFNMADRPDTYTYVGGSITVVASIATTVASYRREQSEQSSMHKVNSHNSLISTHGDVIDKYNSKLETIQLIKGQHSDNSL